MSQENPNLYTDPAPAPSDAIESVEEIPAAEMPAAAPLKNPEWFKLGEKIAAEPEAASEADAELLKRFSPDLVGEKTNYVESEDERNKIVELEGIAQNWKSMVKIEYPGVENPIPRGLVWLQLKKHFETAMNEDKNYTKEDLMKVRLYHILIGSTDITGLPIKSFDLPEGEIEQFIRTGSFLSSKPMPPIEGI